MHFFVFHGQNKFVAIATYVFMFTPLRRLLYNRIPCSFVILAILIEIFAKTW